MSSGPKVELLWWRECPSWERALALVRKEMASAGVDPDSLQVTEVDTEEAATREQFIGSPTIRIGGADIQPGGSDDHVGLACRVYHLRDGRVSPLPDPADLRDALAAAVEGSAG